MSYEKIEKEIVDKILEMESLARVEVDRHWKYHMEVNLNEEPKDKARLNVWVRRRKEVLEIYWTHLKFIPAGPLWRIHRRGQLCAVPGIRRIQLYLRVHVPE